MAKQHLYYDKTELTIAVRMGNNYSAFHVPAEKIQRINYIPVKTKKLFKTIETEAISFDTVGFPPLMLVKAQEKDFYDGYKRDVEKFAKENRIKINDYTGLSLAEYEAKLASDSI